MRLFEGSAYGFDFILGVEFCRGNVRFNRYLIHNLNEVRFTIDWGGTWVEWVLCGWWP